MMRANAANERTKREYFRYLKEALGRDEATTDAVVKSLARFEDSARKRRPAYGGASSACWILQYKTA